MIRADDELVELLEDFFATEVAPELVDQVERSGEWPSALWHKVGQVEIPAIGINEADGGVGGSLADVAALIQLAAYRATPLPLLENHLASFLVAETGLDPIDGPLTFAGLGPDAVPRVIDGTLTGRVEAVPWAGAATAAVVLTADESGRDVIAIIDLVDVALEPHVDLAGTPIPTVILDGAAVRVASLADRDALVRRAEVLHCADLAGLLRRLYDLTAQYVSERQQFGKPVGSFQAVQIHTVTLAQAASIAMLAVDRAVSAVADGGGRLEAAAASVVVGEHAVLAARAAHQAHGAIGMTREYPLQQLTRRLQARRQAWGSLTAAQESMGWHALAAPSLSDLIARHPKEGLPA
jgi:acyl-CoA dehydrogenase